MQVTCDAYELADDGLLQYLEVSLWMNPADVSTNRRLVAVRGGNSHAGQRISTTYRAKAEVMRASLACIQRTMPTTILPVQRTRTISGKKFTEKVPTPFLFGSGKLTVSLDFYFATRAPDIDGPIKCILDVMSKAGFYRNDNQIYSLHTTKRVVACKSELQIRARVERRMNE